MAPVAVSDGVGETVRLHATIPPAAAGRRLDQVLAELFPDYSRSRLQTWIRAGQVRIDGRPGRPRDPVAGGEEVVVEAAAAADTRWLAEALPLQVVYQDRDLLVIDKPAGLVTHPAAGNWSGTLVNGLLHLAPELAALPRAGIVHRLDKETSGLLVVARTLQAHQALVAALARRDVRREYLAVVHGVPTGGGSVDAPIGRHPVERTRMAVVAGGRPAVTHYRVAERFRANALLDVRLETGRTHQIRVHLAHVRHPLVGDPAYGGRPRLPRGATPELRALLQGFPRLALHAARLALAHPRSGEPLAWEAPLPADLAGLLAALRRDAATVGDRG
jgi:23S rRNA pseudouridine1911/1915/1917 synthase